MKSILLSTLLSTLLLFIWSGLSQVFPWGVPSAQTVSTQSIPDSLSFQAPDLIELPTGSLNTEAFDRRFVGQVSTLTTDQTFSWIVSKPLSDYKVGDYFLREFFTQLLVALGLAFLLRSTQSLSRSQRVQLVLLAGLMAVAGIYGQQMNWWGLPALYALGAGFNLLAGWLLAAVVSMRWIWPSSVPRA